VSRTWAGDIPHDDVCYVGAVEFDLPVTRESPRVTGWINY
jgi:hypothetical protein